MIQLGSKNLSQTTQNELDKLQGIVDAKTTFAEQAGEAKRLWNKKTTTKEGKQAFGEIKTSLVEITVANGICNYCECDRASDIEHIHPKSFFPELTFIWENYLLACKKCNTENKLDKCYVVDSIGNIQLLKRGTQPPANSTVAFINPRIENPHDFMILNLNTYKFLVLKNLSEENQWKAKQTIEILKLNDDEVLIGAREAAEEFFMQKMERLTKILAANSNAELKDIIYPRDGRIDMVLSLQDNKNKIEEGFKKSIQTHKHPSVWYAIKMVQSKVNPKWQNLFSQIPQALNW